MSKTILVTGANDGIGLELVKLFASQGHTVFLGSRNEERGRAAVEQLGAANVHLVQIDISDEASIRAAVQKIEQSSGHLDVLVNNAGVGNLQNSAGQNPAYIDIALLRSTFDTNFFGTIAATTAFVPLLSKSSQPTILVVSTDMASTSLMASAVDNHQSPLRHVNVAAYNTSKAALNSYVVSLAIALPNFKINAATPGYTSTKLNGFGKAGGSPLTTEKAAEYLSQYALLGNDGPTGKFFKFSGHQGW
jgi:NAD(P)-dependent dehydrogenase (short-subunit alcohol dehydrogenase family)